MVLTCHTQGVDGQIIVCNHAENQATPPPIIGHRVKLGASFTLQIVEKEKRNNKNRAEHPVYHSSHLDIVRLLIFRGSDESFPFRPANFVLLLSKKRSRQKRKKEEIADQSRPINSIKCSYEKSVQ